MTRHAPGVLAEFALCGLADDAHDSGAAAEPLALALPGQEVTCPDCRRHLDHVRRAFLRYRVRATTPPPRP